MPVLSDVVDTFFELIVLTANGNFWIIPLLHSGSDNPEIGCECCSDVKHLCVALPAS